MRIGSFRGFTPVEVMFSMALVALLAGLAVVNMRSGPSGADTHSLATLVLKNSVPLAS